MRSGGGSDSRASPEVRSLRDVDMRMLGEIRSDTILRRARHVVSEDERVGKFVDACRSSDLNKLGELFVESHRSLQLDYEVSCEELDFWSRRRCRSKACTALV